MRGSSPSLDAIGPSFAATGLVEGRVEAVLLESGSGSPGPEAFADLLTRRERERRDRFRFAADQRRYAVGRGALRILLGELLGLSPADVPLRADASGKPRAPGTAIRFNLSHSGSKHLLAFTLGREVGADIEEIRDNVLDEGLCRMVFSDAELARWQDMGETDRRRTFFRTWAMKESLLKAAGVGLGIQPSEIDLSPKVEGGVQLAGEHGTWSVRALDAGPAYAAAVAVAGRQLELRLTICQLDVC